MSNTMDSPASLAPPAVPARILAVDDEGANLMLLRALLQRDGHELETTRDPREALPLFEFYRPDLVLLDLHMPGLDGLTVMRQIRESRVEDGYLPILLLTGDGSLEARQRALAAGATDFIMKPFDGMEVTLRIRNFLETRRLHAAVQAHNAQLEALVHERTRELEIALARAEAATVAKSRFLANMSHELRTPLNPIRGALELLADEAGEKAARLLEMANRNVDRMATLIDDILYLQAIEQGSVKPERYPVHLSALVHESAEAVEGRASRAELELRVELPESPSRIDTDPMLLSEVLRRLLDNAVRFTASGGITIRVEAHPLTGATTRLVIRDTGIGIEAGRLADIFHPFEQADNSSTRGYEGAGLGLAICRALCELLGYRLEASSEPGRGSDFSILLDASLPDQAA